MTFESPVVILKKTHTNHTPQRLKEVVFFQKKIKIKSFEARKFGCEQKKIPDVSTELSYYEFRLACVELEDALGKKKPKKKTKKKKRRNKRRDINGWMVCLFSKN